MNRNMTILTICAIWIGELDDDRQTYPESTTELFLSARFFSRGSFRRYIPAA